MILTRFQFRGSDDAPPSINNLSAEDCQVSYDDEIENAFYPDGENGESGFYSENDFYPDVPSLMTGNFVNGSV